MANRTATTRSLEGWTRADAARNVVERSRIVPEAVVSRPRKNVSISYRCPSSASAREGGRLKRYQTPEP